MQTLIAETYGAHQPIIGQWARQSPENFSDVYRFILATIQQPLSSTPAIVKDFKEKGSESRYAFSAKRAGLDYIAEYAEETYETSLELWDAGREALLSYFASLPGIGLVKGGFLAQCVFGEIGCLDTHNINRFGLDASRFSAYRFKRAKNAKTRQAIIAEYLDLCDRCGGSAQLWAEWCEYVSTRDSAYTSAVDVSKMHLTALGLDK